MVKALYSVVFCLFMLTAVAQQAVKQPDLKAEYEVPSDWKVQEYYKGDWDKPAGSSICHCALSVNILKVPFNGDFDYLHMVVYPSDKKGAADPQRSSVWQYKIAHGDNGDSVKTAHLTWKMYTGKLTTQGENRFKDCIAYTYQTHHERVYYTVHFWGKPGLMSQYKAVIDKIMAGFRPL